jgi:hypothetical protein
MAGARTQVPLTIDFSQNPVPGVAPRPRDPALVTGQNAAPKRRPAVTPTAPPVRHGVQNPLPTPPEE